MTDSPWFGFSTELGENIRATNLLVAAWFLLFSLPIFFLVREDRSCVTRGGGIVRASWKQLLETFREIRHHRQIVRFLIARLVFNDALITVFFMGGLYASGTFGFEERELLVFGSSSMSRQGSVRFFSDSSTIDSAARRRSS